MATPQVCGALVDPRATDPNYPPCHHAAIFTYVFTVYDFTVFRTLRVYSGSGHLLIAAACAGGVANTRVKPVSVAI